MSHTHSRQSGKAQGSQQQEKKQTLFGGPTYSTQGLIGSGGGLASAQAFASSSRHSKMSGRGSPYYQAQQQFNKTAGPTQSTSSRDQRSRKRESSQRAQQYQDQDEINLPMQHAPQQDDLGPLSQVSSEVQSMNYNAHNQEMPFRVTRGSNMPPNTQQQTFGGHGGVTDGQDNAMLATGSSGMRNVDLGDDMVEDLARDPHSGLNTDRMSVSPQPMGVIGVPTSRIGASNRMDEKPAFRINSMGPGQAMVEKQNSIGGSSRGPSLASYAKSEFQAQQQQEQKSGGINVIPQYSSRRHHGQAFIQSSYGMASAALRKQDNGVMDRLKAVGQNEQSSEEPRNEHQGSTFVGKYHADANQVNRMSNKLGTAIKPSEKPSGPRGRSSPFEDPLMSDANRQSEVMEEGMPKNIIKMEATRRINEKQLSAYSNRPVSPSPDMPRVSQLSQSKPIGPSNQPTIGRFAVNNPGPAKSFRPGTSLAGGAGISKLNKLEGKDQDEVNDVTEDEASDEYNDSPTNGGHYQSNQVESQTRKPPAETTLPRTSTIVMAQKAGGGSFKHRDTFGAHGRINSNDYSPDAKPFTYAGMTNQQKNSAVFSIKNSDYYAASPKQPDQQMRHTPTDPHKNSVVSRQNDEVKRNESVESLRSRSKSQDRVNTQQSRPSGGLSKAGHKANGNKNSPDESKRLRDEYLKVKRELELLKTKNQGKPATTMSKQVLRNQSSDGGLQSTVQSKSRDITNSKLDSTQKQMNTFSGPPNQYKKNREMTRSHNDVESVKRSDHKRVDTELPQLKKGNFFDTHEQRNSEAVADSARQPQGLMHHDTVTSSKRVLSPRRKKGIFDHRLSEQPMLDSKRDLSLDADRKLIQRTLTRKGDDDSKAQKSHRRQTYKQNRGSSIASREDIGSPPSKSPSKRAVAPGGVSKTLRNSTRQADDRKLSKKGKSSQVIGETRRQTQGSMDDYAELDKVPHTHDGHLSDESEDDDLQQHRQKYASNAKKMATVATSLQGAEFDSLRSGVVKYNPSSALGASLVSKQGGSTQNLYLAGARKSPSRKLRTTAPSKGGTKRSQKATSIASYKDVEVIEMTGSIAHARRMAAAEEQHDDEAAGAEGDSSDDRGREASSGEIERNGTNSARLHDTDQFHSNLRGQNKTAVAQASQKGSQKQIRGSKVRTVTGVSSQRHDSQLRAGTSSSAMLKGKQALTKNATLGSKKRKKDTTSTELLKANRSEPASEFRNNLHKMGRAAAKDHKESASSIYGALVHGKGSKQQLSKKQATKNSRRKVTGTKSFSSDRHSSNPSGSDSEAHRAPADYSASASSNSEGAVQVPRDSVVSQGSPVAAHERSYDSRSAQSRSDDSSDRHQSRTAPRQVKDRSSRSRVHGKRSQRLDDDRERAHRTRNNKSPLNLRNNSMAQNMSHTNNSTMRGPPGSVHEELQRQIQMHGVENVFGALQQLQPGQASGQGSLNLTAPLSQQDTINQNLMTGTGRGNDLMVQPPMSLLNRGNQLLFPSAAGQQFQTQQPFGMPQREALEQQYYQIAQLQQQLREQQQALQQQQYQHHQEVKVQSLMAQLQQQQAELRALQSAQLEQTSPSPIGTGGLLKSQFATASSPQPQFDAHNSSNLAGQGLYQPINTSYNKPNYEGANGAPQGRAGKSGVSSPHHLQSQLSMGNIQGAAMEHFRRAGSGIPAVDTTVQSNFFVEGLTKNEDSAAGNRNDGTLESAFRAARRRRDEENLTGPNAISDFDITEALETNHANDRGAGNQNISGLLRATDTRPTHGPGQFDAFETSKDQSELIVDGDRRAADLLNDQDDGGATAAMNFARDRPPIYRREKAPDKIRQLSDMERSSIGNNRNEERGSPDAPPLLWPSQQKSGNANTSENNVLQPSDTARSKNVFDTRYEEDSKLEDSPNFRRGQNKAFENSSAKDVMRGAETPVGGEGRISEASDQQKILFFPMGSGKELPKSKEPGTSPVKPWLRGKKSTNEGGTDYITVREINPLAKAKRNKPSTSRTPGTDKSKQDQEPAQGPPQNDENDLFSSKRKVKAATEDEVKAAADAKRRANAELLVQDDMPSLQEAAAKLGGGRAVPPWRAKREAEAKASASPAGGQLGGEPQQDQDTHDSRPTAAKAPKEGKTKEELAAIRKAWMKTKFRDRANPKDPLSAISPTPDQSTDLFNKSLKQEKKETDGAQSARATDLMARLVSGGKAKVSSAQMRALTSKNYEKLPEIQKKKAEERQREEAAEKKRKIAQMQKEMNDRIRSGLKKKAEKKKSTGTK